MIVCYSGKLGQGKTYAMTEQVLRDLDDGRIVYTNYHIDWSPPKRRIRKVFEFLKMLDPVEYPENNIRQFRDISELHSMSNAVVALDEGWIYIDSYNALSKDLRIRLLQSRKRSLDIYYTTQRPMQIHKSLRAMTNVFYSCYAYNIPFLKFPVFKREENDIAASGEFIQVIDPETGIPKPMSFSTRLIWPSKRVFKSFDTLEEIGDELVETPKKLQHATKFLSTENPQLPEKIAHSTVKKLPPKRKRSKWSDMFKKRPAQKPKLNQSMQINLKKRPTTDGINPRQKTV